MGKFGASLILFASASVVNLPGLFFARTRRAHIRPEVKLLGPGAFVVAPEEVAARDSKHRGLKTRPSSPIAPPISGPALIICSLVVPLVSLPPPSSPRSPA